MKVPEGWSKWWSRWRWLVLALIAFPLLGLMGVIGTGQERFQGERFVSKLVVVRPDGDDGVRITETVDVNFGPNFRHGYERIIPHDFGAPVDITAESNANATLNVETPEEPPEVWSPFYTPADYEGTRIRVGSPNQTFIGTKRYVLSYTLPRAQVSTGRLRLDIIGNDETLTTDRFEVVIDGFQLINPTCSTGPVQIYGGCDLAMADDGTYRAVIQPLEPGAGLTIGGDDVVATGAKPVAVAVTKQPPGTRPGWQVALVLLAVEAGVVIVLYAIIAFFGANRVAAGGPTEAAFASGVDTPNDVKSRRVTDAKLDDLATIEFAPPAGMRPWQGAVLMNEVIDSRSVGAWVSEMIAQGAIVVDGSKLAIGRDTTVYDLGEDDRELLERIFDERKSFSTGFMPPSIARAWNRIAFRQEVEMRKSGWWLRRPPEQRVRSISEGANWSVISFVGVIVLVIAVVFHQAIVPLFYATAAALSILTAPLLSAVGITVIGIGLVVWQVLKALLPVRSVQGSAAALQVMSFRNFLTGSEGFHVDAAWDRSRIREYSAWAVALDAADAWAANLGEMGPTALEPAAVTTMSMARIADRVTSMMERAPEWDYTNRMRYGAQRRADPWRSIATVLKNADWGSGGGYSGGSSGGGSSSSVGGGGGGGSSGTW